MNSSRYSRQIRFQPIGEVGQARLKASNASIVGCGALGSVMAEILARAGVGTLRLIDRDLIEESNLQRQFLYDQQDVVDDLPKVEAAKRRIAEINSEIKVETFVQSLSENNIEKLLGKSHIILDGTDNFPARYLMNDFSVRRSIPWVYGAAVGSYGLTMAVLPGKSACLRCVFPEAPSGENSPTCETAGVLASITATIASMEAAEAIKILTGNLAQVSQSLTSIDLWNHSIQTLRPERNPDCPSCGKQSPRDIVPPQSMKNEITAESLCGRNAVQISRNAQASCDLESEAKRLSQSTKILSQNKFLLRFGADGLEASLFPDGRVIVWETTDVEQATDFYHRFFAPGGSLS